MRIATGVAILFMTCCLGSCSAPAPEAKLTSGQPTKVSLEQLGFEQPKFANLSRTVHRLGAGDRDSSGWCHASSTDGSFSISLPNVFYDVTITGKAEDGVEVKMYFLGTRTERLVKFTAVGMHRPDGKFKDTRLERFAEMFEKKGELKSKRSISLGEMKGIELRIQSRSALAVFHIYQGPTTLYQLIVEGPGSTKPEDIEAEVKRFLNSFTLAEKPNQ